MKMQSQRKILVPWYIDVNLNKADEDKVNILFLCHTTRHNPHRYNEYKPSCYLNISTHQ